MNSKFIHGDKIIKLLRHNQAQIAIISQHLLSDELELKELQPEHFVLVTSYQWKKSSLKDIIKNERIIDFNPPDKMKFQYLQHHDLIHLANKDRYFANQTDVLANMIANEIGYGAY